MIVVLSPVQKKDDKITHDWKERNTSERQLLLSAHKTNSENFSTKKIWGDQCGLDSWNEVTTDSDCQHNDWWASVHSCTNQNSGDCLGSQRKYYLLSSTSILLSCWSPYRWILCHQSEALSSIYSLPVPDYRTINSWGAFSEISWQRDYLITRFPS